MANTKRKKKHPKAATKVGEFRVTTAGMGGTRTVDLPSGSRVRLRPPRMPELMSAGIAQYVNAMQGIVQSEHVDRVQSPGKAAKSAEQVNADTLAQFEKNPEMLTVVEQLVEKLAPVCILEPKVLPVPEPRKVAVTVDNYVLDRFGNPVKVTDDDGNVVTETDDDGDECELFVIDEQQPTKTEYIFEDREREPGAVYADDFSFGDRMALVNAFMGVTSDAALSNPAVATFPEGRADAVEGVPGEQDPEVSSV